MTDPHGVFVETADDGEVSKAEFREYPPPDRVFVGFPDYTVDEKQVISPYDWTTVIEYTVLATHEDPLGDKPPTGNTVTLPIEAMITVSDDGITPGRDDTNSHRFAEQGGIN